jgi:hypothetical protein
VRLHSSLVRTTWIWRLERERETADKSRTVLANMSKPIPVNVQTTKAEVNKSGHVAFDLSELVFTQEVVGGVIGLHLIRENHRLVTLYATIPNPGGVPVPSGSH